MSIQNLLVRISPQKCVLIIGQNQIDERRMGQTPLTVEEAKKIQQAIEKAFAPKPDGGEPVFKRNSK